MLIVKIFELLIHYEAAYAAIPFREQAEVRLKPYYAVPILLSEICRHFNSHEDMTKIRRLRGFVYCQAWSILMIHLDHTFGWRQTGKGPRRQKAQDVYFRDLSRNHWRMEELLKLPYPVCFYVMLFFENFEPFLLVQKQSQKKI